MNAMSMNALGTFDPRDAMERWNQQTQNAQQNALLPGGGDAISFLPQPVQISGPMMPAMPQPQAMPMMPGSNAYDGGDYAGSAGSAPAPAPAPAAPAKQSPNHSYDHGLGFGSGLAGRGPVSTTRAGRVAAAQKAGTFGSIQESYNAANPTRWMDDNGQIGQRPKSVPFGGYRANGGPVQPGRAYVVGERGPELMVPQVPGTIVPNAATGGPGMLVAGPGGSVVWQRGTGPGTTLPPQTTPAAPTQSTSMPMMRPANNSRIAQSPSNRPYAELAGGTGSLANRGTRPVGRSGTDAGRLNEQAIRRLKSQGDIVGAARLANSNAWLDARLGGPAMRAPQPMPMMMPPQPSANRAAMPMPGTPGQSLPAPEMPMPDAGATADAAAPAAPPPMDAPPMSFEQAFNQSPLAGAGLPPMNQAMPPMQVPAGTFAQMPGLNQGAFKGAYVEAPPLVGSAPIPGTDQMQPMVKGEPKGAPVSRTQPPKPAAWEAPKMYDETIPEVRDANGNVTQPARTRQYYFVQDPQTGKPRKEYALDANGDGVPDNAAGQQPGWMGWLQSQK